MSGQGESSTESFAGLLGRLTGHPISEVTEKDLRPLGSLQNQLSERAGNRAGDRDKDRYRELPGLEADSLSLSARAMRSELLESTRSGASARSTRRPQTAVATELSYEKALQLHARRIPSPLPLSSNSRVHSATLNNQKSAPKPDLATPKPMWEEVQDSAANLPRQETRQGVIPVVKSTPSRRAEGVVNSQRDVVKASSSTSPPASQKSRRRESAQASDASDRKIAEDGHHVKSGTKQRKGVGKHSDLRNTSISAATIAEDRDEAARSSAASRPAKGNSKLPEKSDARVSFSPSHSSSKSRSGVKRSAQDLDRDLNQSSDRGAEHFTAPILENGKLPLADATDGLELSLVNQRKSIVSIRLTDPEIAMLRDRADESGISVSAYMRSCVLEAEMLRTQVKRAMAEMRALNSDSGRQTYQALAVPNDNGGERSGDRLRGFLRSINVLLSPLLVFRRSA